MVLSGPLQDAVEAAHLSHGLAKAISRLTDQPSDLGRIAHGRFYTSTPPPLRRLQSVSSHLGLR